MDIFHLPLFPAYIGAILLCCSLPQKLFQSLKDDTPCRCGGWMHHIGFRSHGQISHRKQVRGVGRDNQTNMNRRREMTSAVKFSDLSGGGGGVGVSLRPTEKERGCRQFNEIESLLWRKSSERKRERSWWIGWRRKCEACQPILLPLLPSDFTQQPRNYYGAISYENSYLRILDRFFQNPRRNLDLYDTSKNKEHFK